MDNGIELLAPGDIEKRSFEIISSELDAMGVTLDDAYASVIKRVIHTTADFDYVNTFAHSDGAIERLISLLKGGACIVTDTNMALAGINKRILSDLGCEWVSYMSDDDVAREAKDKGLTRAIVSVQRAAALGKKVVYAVGNAPTALLQILEEHAKNPDFPAFVIGVPVGFVNVVAAKELLIKSDIPHMVNRGRKGGSTVAAAIINAVLYDIAR